jgi:hypothetical protein
MSDREKLTDLIASYMEFVKTATPKEMATYLISNGVVVREKGEWENENSRPKTYIRRCTTCGGKAYFCGVGCSYNFCPNCGADMRKGENG